MNENKVDAAPKTAAPGDDLNRVDLGAYGVEDWLSFVVFWALTIVVFLQFFTRYVLNDSLAWTEEIARYLLISVAFVGGGMAMRRVTHIHVEFLYLYLGPRIGNALSVLVDVVRIAFFGYGTWLAWKVTAIMQTQRMVVIDWPLSITYWPVVLGFAVMTLRAVQVALGNWRTGESALTAVAREGRHQ